MPVALFASIAVVSAVRGRGIGVDGSGGGHFRRDAGGGLRCLCCGEGQKLRETSHAGRHNIGDRGVLLVCAKDWAGMRARAAVNSAAARNNFCI